MSANRATHAPSRGEKVSRTIVGCLIDVSGSMQTALETGKGDGRAVNRLHAVLRAVLQFARAEQLRNPNAFMFLGAFGLQNKYAPVVDLYGLAKAMLGNEEDSIHRENPHEALVGLAGARGVDHISDYIRAKLTRHQAWIVYRHLQRHPDQILEFVKAIPMREEWGAWIVQKSEGAVDVGKKLGGAFGELISRPIDTWNQARVENSEAIQMARRICDKWFQDFETLQAHCVDDVVSFLEGLQEDLSPENTSSGVDQNLLDDLKPHLYGHTPMKLALSKALSTFDAYSHFDHRVLVLISDGLSTDGDPMDLKENLEKQKIMLATIYLTDKDPMAQRQLYDQSSYEHFESGQQTLLKMATMVKADEHPIPVLASIGWGVPSSGKCALFATVSSSNALEEFCSVLLTARFGSANAMLDILGKVGLDSIIHDEHVITCRNPSDQGQAKECYAHAIAAVIYMALVRIVGWRGGHTTIATIRQRIINNFPPGPNGRNTENVLQQCIGWYQPLCFQEVDENGARQALLHRRPVLATFHLSTKGWEEFHQFYNDSNTCRSILSKSAMDPYRSSLHGDGHAVVLVECNPGALTFLNSWGNQWANNGSFSIENSQVLGIDSIQGCERMTFYDITWPEKELTDGERQAYDASVDERVGERSAQYRSMFDLEVQCPRCRRIAEIARFTGSIRPAICPLCTQSFQPEPGYLMQALYIRSGISGSR